LGDRNLGIPDCSEQKTASIVMSRLPDLSTLPGVRGHADRRIAQPISGSMVALNAQNITKADAFYPKNQNS
jgi:hypothetical protein